MTDAPNYNATVDIIERNLARGRRAHVAVIDDRGATTYAALVNKINRCANLLQTLGVQREQRVLIVMHDCVEFVALFWGALKAGVIPVPVNTMLTADDYAYLCADSRAKVVFVSPALEEKFPPHAARVTWGAALDALIANASREFVAADTNPDEVAFWLYSSGSTGRAKGTLHLQSHLAHTAALYGEPILQINADDVVYSAAKLFFAYGLGNAMTFPFSVGATSVLLAERPTPSAVMRVLAQHQPTIFFGVPTLYASLLADPANHRGTASQRLRRCVSAGESLPADVGERWRARFGADILDGLGSTEMLHIFLSSRGDDLRYGTTGKPVPGYDLEIVDERDRVVPVGEMGELRVRGPSSAVGYWNNREKSRATFRGAWTYTGDRYREEADGNFVYCGRGDDMIKSGGIWVAPNEVENALSAHPAVLECGVIGHADEHGLIKPRAFVVCKDGIAHNDALAHELQLFVKARLAPYKFPRWITFVEALPKTATGKIQRFVLRAGWPAPR